MILQELFEASTFRKRSTSEMTYGFEFEVMLDTEQIDVSYEDMKQEVRDKNEFNDWWMLSQFMDNIVEKDDSPVNRYASKKEVAEYYKNTSNSEIVNYIYNNTKNYEERAILLIYFDRVAKKALSIDEFLDYYKSNKDLEKILKKDPNSDEKNKKIINDMFKKYPYVSEILDDEINYNYVLDENDKVVPLRQLDYDELDEFFENSEEILKRIEDKYEEFIESKASNRYRDIKTDFFFLKEQVELVLEANNINIKNLEIKNDDSLGMKGIEIITKVIHGIDEAISQFNKIINVIKDEPLFYTDEDTGLHINIGTWKDSSELDVLKFLIFSNETQILKRMERTINRFSRPIKFDIINNLKDSQFDNNNYKEIIKQINKSLINDAHHFKFVDLTKLVHDGYVEIRGFGNENYENKSEYIIKIINYISRVLQIASKPEEAKQQYIKKLYKLINDESDLSGEHKKQQTSIFGLDKSEIEYLSKNFKIDLSKIKNPSDIKIYLTRPLYDYVSLKISDWEIENEIKENQLNLFSPKDLRILYKLFKNIDKISKDIFIKKISKNLEKTNDEKAKNFFQKLS